MKLCVYVEGGGPNKGAEIASACRKAFHIFFKKLLSDGKKPRIVASGSRDNAYKDFCLAMDDPNTFPVLLVDSEAPVPIGKTAKAHLQGREKHWKAVVPEHQVYLMVQCMETWFLADVPAVVLFYDNDFTESALRCNPKIEDIPKRDVMRRLKVVTSRTTKGPYHKTRHGFDILERIDPSRVRQRSGHADALFKFLVAKLT